MKRTNLVLDAKILDEATSALGAKTYSKTVMIALEEAIRRRKMRGVLAHFGSDIWEGNLSEMREDHPKSKRAK